MKSLYLIPLLSFALVGCLASPQSPPLPSVTPSPALAWENGHPERKAWSAHLRQSLMAQVARFGTPADIAAYCPNYANLPDADRIEVLATLAVAIAKRESNYKPDTVFAEPPPLGVDSIGLFQMSYEDNLSWCSMDKSNDSLKDPLNNISCAVGKMAQLVGRDGVIASGATVKAGKGLSRYWSVIQDGPTHFKAEIQASTGALAICKR